MKKHGWILLMLSVLLSIIMVQAQGESEVSDLRYEKDENGIAFTLDVLVEGFAEQELFVYVWFYDGDNAQYVANPSADEAYRTTNDSLTLWEDITPCCDCNQL